MSQDSVGGGGGGGGGSNTNTGSRMKHSLSTPSGVDGSTTPQHHRGSSAGINVNGGGGGGGKKLAVRVQMLDDTITMFQVQVSVCLSSKEMSYQQMSRRGKVISLQCSCLLSP